MKTWDEAKAECEALSPPHHTVVLNSAEEQAFVTGLVSSNAGFWMGCSDIVEGTWLCEDNSGMQWTTGGDVTGYWSKYIRIIIQIIYLLHNVAAKFLIPKIKKIPHLICLKCVQTLFA